jgi:DMSO/TMAO reductase YedYZ molybdopterin-dependent catalytic subunit
MFQFEGFDRRKQEDQIRSEGRLPPGQSLTQKFPVLHYGPVPLFDAVTWDFRVWGEVEEEKRWNWEEFNQLPRAKLHMDIHCVTRWSKFDTVWEGVPFTEFVKLFGIKPAAKYVIAHCDYGYTTNLPLEAMLEDDVLLAYKYDGRFLEPDHGFPVRTLVPKRYFWKSAKFLRALEFSPVDKPGFWEVNGYHNNGDPWTEERYGRRGFF